MTADRAAPFVAVRPRLLSLAYRMTGSRHDAEDLVQDAWLRWDGAQSLGTPIHDASAYLMTVVTRLAVDRFRSARVRRERYVGPWLPEPLVDSATWLGPVESAELRDEVSMAVMLLFERLTPQQRAVMVLRDGFDYPYEKIAQTLSTTAAACRQAHRRARGRLGEGYPAVLADPAQHRRILEQLLTALAGGDLVDLERGLAEDVVLIADGGGQVSAARHPVVGANRVARFLLGLLTMAPPETAVAVVEVNGLPGLVVTVGGSVSHVISIAGVDRVGQISIVRAPDKLSHVTAPPAGLSHLDRLPRL